MESIHRITLLFVQNQAVNDTRPKSPHEERVKDEPVTSRGGAIDGVEDRGHKHGDEAIDQGVGRPGGCRETQHTGSDVGPSERKTIRVK